MEIEIKITEGKDVSIYKCEIDSAEISEKMPDIAMKAVDTHNFMKNCNKIRKKSEDKYTAFMHENFPQNPEGQWLKCLEFSTIMQKEFPNLLLKKGYVYSHENQDNVHPNWPKQYSHAWLYDPENDRIIDPTKLQFTLLGELHYVETEHYTYTCLGCGQYVAESVYKESGVCGKCHLE